MFVSLTKRVPTIARGISATGTPKIYHQPARCRIEFELPNSFHSVHDSIKRKLGDIWGVKTYSIADNNKFIDRLKSWRESATSLSKDHEKDIVKFIEANFVHKETTVFFDKHWRYRMMVWNLPLFMIDILYMNEYTFSFLMYAHLLTILASPCGFDKTLVNLESLRRKLASQMEVDRALGNFKVVRE